jgi:endonuclease YncB( thermonuclease family)
MVVIGLPSFGVVFLLGMLATAWRPDLPDGLDRNPNPGPTIKQFECTVRSVTDGDTFRCTSGVRVRLSSIDTAEMPGSCRPGRSCAPGDPYAAKAALEKLIAGKTITCEPVGKSYNRIAAWCSIDGQDLSCAMLRNGYAIRLTQHDPTGRLCRT